MKLLIFKYKNKIKIGYFNENKISEINCNDILNLFNKTNEEIVKLSLDSFNLNEIKILTPTNPSKIICVGLNYKDHAKELNMNLPEEPIIFIKPSTSAISHESNIIYPKISNELDFEGELAIVIGKKAYGIDKKIADDYIFGYSILNDVTARDIQRKDGQWTRAKSFNTFAPYGPCIETDFDYVNKKILTKLNNTVKQDSNLNNMIFTPKEIVSFISNVMTLNPGDVIATGTPHGVGSMDKKDSISIYIEGIGELRNSVL
ncbi:MAG: fumarylacetoacetate hydrolase family protein [Methanobacteriaceae archaeon]|jgi:2-keto-4-pentenoate hydratase/2-oxohepta-3-ene-1,7-dioic acid hydratase in catechol pathway|nr:fumarylacetoacetate hydrolase family protein [Methanobacteriaceae archaeon]